MTLLDRLKSQPRHDNPDPALRLAHVQELPLDDREAIARYAREDGDARVRKAAVAKLMDPIALGAIAGSDADAAVRSAAHDMLRDFALERFEGTGEAEALAAVEATHDAKALAQIGRAATRETVALRAVSVLVGQGADTHAFGSMARHSVVDTARRAAFEQLQQRGAREELLAVAANSDFKDTALSALELFSDRESLEHVAERGRNKAAAKRARGVLRAADEEADRARRAASLDARLAQAEAIGEAVATAASTASTSTGSTGVTSAGPVAQEGEGGDAVTDRPADAAGAPSAAAASPAGSSATSEAAAEAAPVSVAMSAQEIERRQSRLVELAGEADTAAANPDLASARRRLTLVRREWKDLAVGIDVEPGCHERLARAESVVAGRVAEAKESAAWARQEALVRLDQLLERVEGHASREEASLRTVDIALREVRAALGNMPQLPTKQDYDGVLARLKAAQTVLGEKSRALREALDWKRWSNLTVQERLCAAMEALAGVEDAVTLPKTIRALQTEWRTVADVPPSKSRALWQRFKTAHDVVWARCEAYFAEQSDARGANLTRKNALCEQVEALTGSSDWIRTADAIRALQAEWKTIGPVPRGGDKALWERFHAACDTFYRRRHDDLAARKASWAENLAKKEALCAKAAELASSTAWEEAAVAMKQLQAEWKTIGAVKKTRAEALWQRFHGACDRFLDAFAHRHDAAQAERIQTRESLCEGLEALAQPAEGDAAPVDLPAGLRRVLNGWTVELAHRIDPERARQFETRFAAALDALLATQAAPLAGTELDPQANTQRLEAIVTGMETLARSLAGAGSGQVDQSLSPTARLASMLKEALASNTIGGKVDDDSRWRAAADEVDQAQAKWARVGLVPRDVRRALTDRFARATRAVSERVNARLGASRRVGQESARAGAGPVRAGVGSGRPGGGPVRAGAGPVRAGAGAGREGSGRSGAGGASAGSGRGSTGTGGAGRGQERTRS